MKRKFTYITDSGRGSGSCLLFNFTAAVMICSISHMGHSTADKHLKETIDKVNSSELALVHFQRDYVWEPEKVRKLIHSICMNYPVGSLLLIENGVSGLKQKQFDGQHYVEKEVKHLVLDGQQRLTSLYHAFYEKGDSLYFFDLSKMRKCDTASEEYRVLDEMIVSYERPKRRTVNSRRSKSVVSLKDAEEKYQQELKAFENKYGRNEELVKAMLLPVKALRNLWKTRDEMVKNAKATLTAEQVESFQARCSELIDLISERVDTYMLSQVILDKKTPLNAVARIFETINNTGVKLNTFDLLVARHIDKCDFRQKWEETRETGAQTKFGQELDIFGIDELKFVETIYLFGERQQKTADKVERERGFTPSEIIDYPTEQYQENWDHAIVGYQKAFETLRKFGVYKDKDLPYSPMLMPLAALHARASKDGKIKSIERPEYNRKIAWWFWNSIFRELYKEGASSRRMTHYNGLVDICLNNKAPHSVPAFNSDILLNRNLPDQAALMSTLPGSARYNGVLALILSNNAKDLHSGETITHELITDDHHIFPQNLLISILPNDPSAKQDDKSKKSNPEKFRAIDNVCNRTKIDQKSNKAIKDKDPRLYIREMYHARRGDITLTKQVVGSHLIDCSIEPLTTALSAEMPNSIEEFAALLEKNGLSESDYNTFLESRAQKICELINSVVSTEYAF